MKEKIKDKITMKSSDSSTIIIAPPPTIIGGFETETNLRGDIKFEGAMDREEAKEFLDEMELLLKEYRISKVDLCWAPVHFVGDNKRE